MHGKFNHSFQWDGWRTVSDTSNPEVWGGQVPQMYRTMSNRSDWQGDCGDFGDFMKLVTPKTYKSFRPREDCISGCVLDLGYSNKNILFNGKEVKDVISYDHGKEYGSCKDCFE